MAWDFTRSYIAMVKVQTPMCRHWKEGGAA